VAPVSSYTSVFLKDVLVNTGVDAGYTLDDKGRILVETRRDEEGNVIGTLTNIWDEDRIRRVVWESEGDNRRVEYAYDEDGERVRETNYRDGTLEREVDVNGDEETETLYRKGEAVLRAVWQDGRKVREESLRMTEHRPAARRRGS
jgi:YD repeat-containing protein